MKTPFVEFMVTHRLDADGVSLQSMDTVGVGCSTVGREMERAGFLPGEVLA